MGCSSCSGGLSAYVPAGPRSVIKTTGLVVGGAMALGHFGAYVPGTERSYIKTTGPVESIPNATGGMHPGNFTRADGSQLAGLGEIFGAGQTNWIDGVANEYVVAGGALLLLLVVMK